MNKQLDIEAAAEAIKNEFDNIHKVEIRAVQKTKNRQMGVLLVWVTDYQTKREIYERLGEGENFYPALYEGWEVRVRKYPPYIKKRNRKK